MNCTDILYPPFVSLEVTNYCNHKCQYCYNCRVKQPENMEFDGANILEVVDFIIEHKPLAVSVSGGEPLLFFDKIKGYIKKLCLAGIFVTVYTNGTVINEEMASFFALNNIRVMISFPSSSEQEFSKIVNNKHTYKSVIAALDLLLKYKVNFQPNIVVTALNKDSLEDTIEFLCDKYSVEKIFVSRATRPSNADKDYDSIKLNHEQLNEIYDKCVTLSKKHNIKMASCGGGAICIYENIESRKMFSKICDFGEGGYVVTTSGDVRICSRDDKIYGNIFKDDFFKIRQNMNEWKNHETPKECKNCSYRKSCRGGCQVAKGEYGTEWKYLDCDAAPKKLKTKKAIPFINPLRRFTVQDVSVLEDASAYRISVFLKYIYVEKKIAKILSEKKFIYLKYLWAHKLNVRKANFEISKLLRLEIIK